MSKGEVKIYKILQGADCKIEREYMFKDLKSSDGGFMRFDFAVLDRSGAVKFLVELDGVQHMQQIKYFHKSRKEFLKNQGHDRQKNSYCLAHKIPLYRIPYWELDNIDGINDITQDRFLVKSRFHNDEIWRKKS